MSAKDLYYQIQILRNIIEITGSKEWIGKEVVIDLVKGNITFEDATQTLCNKIEENRIRLKEMKLDARKNSGGLLNALLEKHGFK